MAKKEKVSRLVEAKAESFESLADNIAAIARGFRAMRGSGKLTRDAVVMLIHRAIPYKDEVSRADIERVLIAVERLDTFIEKPKK